VNNPDSFALAREYIAAGWALCAIGPRSKNPIGNRWQEKPRPAEYWRDNSDHGMGLIHVHSGTCSLDVDDLESARIALKAVGVDLDALMSAPDAVRLIGKPGRGKLVYRTTQVLERKALTWPLHDDPSKYGAVLELRGGKAQDVLPPSIHPDTGEPYRWEGDWRSLPLLPQTLLDVWTEWPAAKKDMEAVCPWDDTPEISEGRYEGITRKRYGEGESVITAFNQAHELRAVLQSLGYRRAGPRFISPHSSSGIPGVVILPGSDGRLADGHSHDVFSVWCQLVHHGDVKKAVKAAAEMLDMSHIQVDARDDGAAIAARLMRPRIPPPPAREEANPQETPPPPSAPIPIAALADLEQWLRNRHHGAKRVATVQGALAFAAAMTARRYITTQRQPTNVMLGVVDSSVAGLLPMKGALYEAADAAGERAVIRDEGISSEQTVFRTLYRMPRMFWISEDYGYMVSMVRKQTSGAFSSALKTLLRAYEGSSFYLSPETLGHSKKDIPLSECDIHSPGLAVLALLSEDQMREVAQRSQYGSGAVQQILFARADGPPDDRAGSAPGAPVPMSIVDTVKALRSAEQRALGGLGSRASHPPVPAMVQLDVGVLDAYEEIGAALNVRFQNGDFSNWRGVAKGALVTVKRLSASLAAWENPENPILTADVARWVGDWVVYHVSRSVEWFDTIATDDGEPDLVQDVLRVIHKAGSRGISSRDIAEQCRAWRRTKTNERSEILDQLVEDGFCRELASPTGRSKLYVDRSYFANSPTVAP
jgi:hypothetical protein